MKRSRRQSAVGQQSQRRSPPSRRIAFEFLEPRLALTTFTVTSLSDGPVNLADNVVTLRDAVAAANGNVAAFPGGPAGDALSDGIRFQSGLTGTISLTQGQILIRSDLSIQGPGASLLSIRGAAPDRVFQVNDSTNQRAFVSMVGVTISGGLKSSPGSDGGGILNSESLTLQDVIVSGNVALRGGGVFNNSGAVLRLVNSEITGNRAGSRSLTPDGEGGGLFNAGTATLTDSLVSGNSADLGTAGGIRNSGTLTLRGSQVSGNFAIQSIAGIDNAGVLNMVDSVVTDNNAFASNGFASTVGGMRNQPAGTVLIQSSTISNNSATSLGGLYNEGTMTLENSTVSGNVGEVDYGGILTIGTLTLRNSTVAANRTILGGVGAGLANSGPAFSVTMFNTIVADNMRGSGAGTPDNYRGNAANVTSAHNLIGLGDTSGLANGGVNGNQVGVVNALLGPLVSNGGPTQTHLPLAGSPAINAGRNAEIPADIFDVDGDLNTTEQVPFDQRDAGFPRVSGGTVDIGAVEVPLDPSADFNLDASVDGADLLIWQRGLGATGAAATRPNGNADLDDDVDATDLAVWQAQFGSSSVLAASALTATRSAFATAALAESTPPRLLPSKLAAHLVDVAMASYQQQQLGRETHQFANWPFTAPLRRRAAALFGRH